MCLSKGVFKMAKYLAIYLRNEEVELVKNGEVIYSGAAENMPADTYYDKVLKIVSGKIVLNVVD